MPNIDPDGKYWEKLANEMARAFAPDIYPCCKCNHPVITGYCCTNCGDDNPSERK